MEQRHRSGLSGLAALLLAAYTSTAAAGAAELVSGPMAGYPALRQGVIWLQADGAATASITYWPLVGPGEQRESVPVALAAAEDFSATVVLPGLSPGTRYAYEVRLDGVVVAGPEGLSFHTPELWQWRRDPPAFRIALGSCAYINEAAYDRPGKPYGSDFGIFDRIAAEAPAMMLWLGDNLYLREGDFDSPTGMAHRYRHMRRFAPLQRLLRATHHVAIWDDHDFGANNANASFVFADQARALFRRYWPNPTAGSAKLAGVQSMVSYVDADFFLLDGRSFRDDDHAPREPGKQLYGEAQLRWLRNALGASTATFKFIAGGSQFLNTTGGQEGWHHFPEERGRFLDWLARSGIPGVVFLSGDRHASEMMILAREKTYPLYELTCSPLTAGVRSREHAEANGNRIEDSFVDEHNYCLLGISGPRNRRLLRVEVRGTAGNLVWDKEIAAAALHGDAP